MAKKNDAPKTENNFWLSVTALAGVPFIMVLGNSMLIPVLPDIRNALNLTPIAASLLITLFSLTAGIIIPVAGFLSDRYGRKVVIIPAIILYGLGGLIAAFASIFLKQQAFSVILAGRILQGAGAAGTAPIAMALCSDLFQGNERSRSLGAMESSNGLGKVISPVLGAAIGLIAWYTAFIFFPVIVIPVVIGMWLLVKEPESNRAQQKLSEYLKSVKNIFNNKAGLLLSSYLAGAVVLMVLFGILFYLSEYLEQQFGLDGIIKGLALAIPVLFMSATSFATGFIIKKKKTLMKFLVVAGLAIMTAALAFLPLAKGVIIYFLAISIVGVSTGMALPCLNNLITSAASMEERGLVTSLYGSVRFLGVAFGPPIYGFLMARSTNLMFWSSAALALLTAVAALVFIKDPGNAETQKQTAPQAKKGLWSTIGLKINPAKKPAK
ncbi:MFS transporter [Pelotomaculum terephthalicicum JT]|uniref:MFS transporter n=1 Tax=Pelotomaculum TaxID=191373 RepID=UPI0009CB3ACD|nr:MULTISPECIES: MFS transporter [Pelotomaculum]MCG9967098.1 MFS transporter [Pelotomaculum terephthalicicum JT]OPX87804.1 MAG: Bacillibactin exporter [Pelotomaculum sp. PtaB.Bin117]OPY63856.1 MAG: Bacillibactin exporter [Pelotomaculum sp. PtaU1.Bin065]